MAITVTKHKDGTLLKFTTVLIPDGDKEDLILCGQVDVVDESLRSQGMVNRHVIEDTEEKYHKTLREEASKADALITSYCTNPEWNPEGYSKSIDN
jgi:hypothetical protein